MNKNWNMLQNKALFHQDLGNNFKFQKCVTVRPVKKSQKLGPWLNLRCPPLPPFEIGPPLQVQFVYRFKMIYVVWNMKWLKDQTCIDAGVMNIWKDDPKISRLTKFKINPLFLWIIQRLKWYMENSDKLQLV